MRSVAVWFPGTTSAGIGWLARRTSLVKFRYHLTFVNVMFGALIFAPRWDWLLAPRLLALYVSFNVFLYSGLYTINDLADRRSDSEHPLKRRRPIASGLVSLAEARAWAAVFLIAGLASGVFWFDASIAACYGAIVLINLVYSTGGRNVRYLDVILNSLPHAVRFLMGALLVARHPSLFHLVALLLLAIAFSCLRRRVEQDVEGWEARQSLRAWSIATLNRVMLGSLGALAVLAVWHAASAPGFYTALIGTAATLIGGAHTSRYVRCRLRWIWTH